MSSGNKKYGLIVPGKTKTPQIGFEATKNVFGDESDSDDDGKKPVLLRPSENINRQAKISQEKAVMEDPTVFQYDEIYDSMSSQKEELKTKIKEEKKPRYIENLLKAANKRKIESERRMERKIQLERENEGEEFADKEVFVTSAYKKKLEELREEEEKEKREEFLESIGDVTKQRDLGGFYRHIYEQKLGPDKTLKEKQTTPEKETSSKDNVETKIESNKKTETKRNYRKRHADTKNLSEGEIEESEEEINRVNLEDIRAKKLKQSEENIDADSDFSIDSSSSDDESGTDKKVKKSKKKSSKLEAVLMEPVEKDVKVSKTTNDSKKVEDTIQDSGKENTPLTPLPEPKPKIDIWKKRTVGEVFDEALKRYYVRKAARGL